MLLPGGGLFGIVLALWATDGGNAVPITGASGAVPNSPACSAPGRRRLAPQRGRLARAIGNFDDVRRVVDFDPVVDVDEDHVVRRRHDVSRRLAPDRNRHVDRNRQHEEVDRLRGGGRRMKSGEGGGRK